jgi:hypothetical protein
MFKLLRDSSVFAFLCLGLIAGHAQSAAQATAPGSPTVTGISSLTAGEKAQADLAGRDFTAEKFADALAIYKPLVAAHPGESFLAKFAAEAAVNEGEMDYALGLLTPIESANSNDWQATALLARIYAESGDKLRRDAEMGRMADLHNRGVIPAQLQQYLIECVRMNDKTLRIWHSLQPWGNQKVYDYARVFNSSGEIVSRLELESMDLDRITFAKSHPSEAASGVRVFSFDQFNPAVTNTNGTKTYTHGTVDMFAGQPSYDAVRKAFVEIAFGKYQRQETSLFNTQVH